MKSLPKSIAKAIPPEGETYQEPGGLGHAIGEVGDDGGRDVGDDGVVEGVEGNAGEGCEEDEGPL